MSKLGHLCDDFFDYPFKVIGLFEIIVPALTLNYAIRFDLIETKQKFPGIFFTVSFIGNLSQEERIIFYY